MRATALPLPLELTEPVTLASGLDTQLRESLGVGQYDPKTQMATWMWGGVTTSNNACQNTSNDGSTDIQTDFQIDDTDFN